MISHVQSPVPKPVRDRMRTTASTKAGRFGIDNSLVPIVSLAERHLCAELDAHALAAMSFVSIVETDDGPAPGCDHATSCRAVSGTEEAVRLGKVSTDDFRGQAPGSRRTAQPLQLSRHILLAVLRRVVNLAIVRACWPDPVGAASEH